jgi:type IV secretory pathway VirB10-like protein
MTMISNNSRLIANNDGIPKEVKTTRDNKENLILDSHISRVIEGFQQELDNLSRSFDLLATSHSQSKSAKTSTEYYPFSARNQFSSNTRKLQARTPPPTTPPQDPPPPVETPLVGAATPNRNVNPRERQCFNGRSSGDYCWENENEDDSTIRRLRARVAELSLQLNSKKDVEEENRRLKAKVTELSRQILVSKKEAEHENDTASYDTNTRTSRGKEKEQQQGKPHMDLKIHSVDRHQNLDIPYERTHRQERYYDEMIRPVTYSLPTFRSTQFSTTHQDKDENIAAEAEAATKAGIVYPGFTPGTKFVAVREIQI